MKRLFIILFIVFSVTYAYTQIPDPGDQSQTTDLNSYYRYPFSFGVSGNWYLWSVDRPDIIDMIGGEVYGVFRWPLKQSPYIQPILRVGVYGNVDEIHSGESAYRRMQYHVAGGIGFSHRFSKVLEAGIDMYVGYSHSILETLYSYYNSENSGNAFISGAAPEAFAGLGFRFVVSPFYNVALSLGPRVEYFHSLLGIEQLNELFVTGEVSVQFRIGADPDGSFNGDIRSIRFGDPIIEPLFSAMQSYYSINPVGSVTIANIDRYPIENVEVSFYQPGFMDGPTSAASIDLIDTNEEVLVSFPAAFNEKVFEIEGVTPLTGEIIVSYRSRNKTAEQRRSVTFDLYDKTSLTWDDDRKMGAFITPSDRVIRTLASQIRQIHKESVIPALNDKLQYAIQVYNVLSAHGLLYQPDPVSPFSSMQEQISVVDSVSLPRDTLQLITGDCDDLTALYTALLESAGVETAFITTPGHIYAAFNTGLPEREYAQIHPDRDMSLFVENQIWIPVEITMIGRESFLEAWTYGKREFDEHASHPERRGFFQTREVQKIFRPVGLRSSEMVVGIEEPADVVDVFIDDTNALSRIILQQYRERAESRARSRDYNRYGIAAARLHQFGEAQHAFEKVAEISKSDAFSAYANLGSMFYLMEAYDRALESFMHARTIALETQASVSQQATLNLNLAQTLYELERYPEAEEFYKQAEDMDLDAAREHSYLASGSSKGERASAAEAQQILFLEVE